MKKNLRHKLFPHKLFPLLSFFLVGSFVIVNYVQYKNYTKVNNEIKKILNDIDKENLHNQNLRAQIKSFNSNEYIEQIAREKLGMIKPDEIIFYSEDN